MCAVPSGTPLPKNVCQLHNLALINAQLAYGCGLQKSGIDRVWMTIPRSLSDMWHVSLILAVKQIFYGYMEALCTYYGNQTRAACAYCSNLTRAGCAYWSNQTIAVFAYWSNQTRVVCAYWSNQIRAVCAYWSNQELQYMHITVTRHVRYVHIGVTRPDTCGMCILE